MEEWKQFIKLAYQTLSVFTLLIGVFWIVLIIFPTYLPKYDFHVRDEAIYKIDKTTGEIYIFPIIKPEVGWIKIPNTYQSGRLPKKDSFIP